MTRPERFSIVAPLPPHDAWRRVLAVERAAGAGRAVVLAYAPASLADDANRLAETVRDVEAAGRLHHPGAVPVLGTEAVGDSLAVVEAFRPGVSVRALLDAAGRMPPDVGARIAIDACAAVERAHGIDAGDGRRLVHGAIGPERVVVAEDGSALVSGFGTGGGGDPNADVRALAALLCECLAGEAPADPPRALEAPGIPAGLAAAVSRGLGVTPEGVPASAAALAAAIAASGPLASHADVAAYAEAILPGGEGDRAEQRRALAAALGGGEAEEVSEDLIVEPTEPVPRPAPIEPLPRPPATRPGADPAGVFPAPPAPTRRRSRAPLAVALVLVAVGFGAGFAATRIAPLAAPLRERLAGVSVWTPAPSAAPRHAAPAPAPAIADPRPAAPPALRAASGPSKAPTKPSRPAQKSRTGKGILDVRAPNDAEVFLDGRRIGAGGIRLDIPEGAHRIEVRRGPARVAETFTVAPGETWTYDVTPTP